MQNDNIKLSNLCKTFDKYEIVEAQIEIDREYYSTTNNIYSDGEVKSNIDRNGFIHITSVHNASYIFFIDLDNKIYLCIYKYIQESKFIEILQNFQLLIDTINKLKNNNSNKISTDNTDNNISNNYNINDELVTIPTAGLRHGSWASTMWPEIPSMVFPTGTSAWN